MILLLLVGQLLSSESSEQSWTELQWSKMEEVQNPLSQRNPPQGQSASSEPSEQSMTLLQRLLKRVQNPLAH